MSLTNKKSDGMSLVEIEYHGVKGTMCSKQFDLENAFVVCRSITHPKNMIQVAKSFASYKTDQDLPIFLSGVNCLGSEARLDECIKDGMIGNTKCPLSDAAVGMKCEPQTKGNSMFSLHITLELS